MPIDEIEIKGSTLTLQIWKARADSIPVLFNRILKEGEAFSLEEEKPGFHDVDAGTVAIRGYYSVVMPFEVEHLVENPVMDSVMKTTEKTLMKRVETCEFLVTDGNLFTWGAASPRKPLSHQLSQLSGYGVALMEWEFSQLSQLHDRLSQIKGISLCNPKDKELRRVRLTGQIESYTDYNVIDPRNHGIDSVKGLVDSPLGPMTLTVNRKGKLSLCVRKGFVLTLDCLQWVVRLIQDNVLPPIQKMMRS